MKKLPAILIVLMISSMLFSLPILPVQAQENKPCESCGMTVDPTGQARYRIVDAGSHEHAACCIICALKLLRTYNQLTITSFCDYNGPDYPITITASSNGTACAVNPTTAVILLGGGCAKNRLVYDIASADSLLAPPNNGTSRWLSPLSNATVLPNATRMSVPEAALKNGGASTSPSPSPTSTPASSPEPTESLTPTQTPYATQSPISTLNPTKTATPQPSTPSPSPSSTNSPTVTLSPSVNTPTPVAPVGQQPTATADQVCEACGMTVTADDQWHFKITDGSGQVHYAECFMCALNLVKHYDTLHIETFCDWYGPTYPITIDSTGFGAQVVVNPTTALYLYTGSCGNNRVAYNQAAADFLKNSYSQYTSVFQQHDWQSVPTIATVTEGVNMYNVMSAQETAKPIMIPILIAAVVIAVVAIGVFAFFKLRNKQSNANSPKRSSS
jgi:hypothetical protein